MSRALSLCVLLCAAFGAACSDGTGPAPAVTVTSVSPSNGPLAGGTAVTVTGTNFPTTIDSVRVGTGRLGNLTRVSATQLTGTTLASGTAGTVDAVVYTTSAGSGTCTGCFTYIATANGQNVALAAAVTVSATGACYLGTCPIAAGVNDGSASSPGAFWSGASGSSTGWVQLTLDQPYILSKIRVFSQYWDASEYGTEGGLSYRVLVSSDQSNWTEVRSASFALHKTINISWAREDISFTPQMVKYIKVDIVNSTGVATHIWRTGIREIEAGDANLPLHPWGAFF